MILNSGITSKGTHDLSLLKTMFTQMKIYGIDLNGSSFDEDKEYNSDDGCNTYLR